MGGCRGAHRLAAGPASGPAAVCLIRHLRLLASRGAPSLGEAAG